MTMKKAICVFLINCFFICSVASAATFNDLGVGSAILPVKSVNAVEKSLPDFANDNALESPINEKEYILGPGDVLAVHLLIGNSEMAVN